ncbi:MAG: hypothetical protein Q9203_006532, partial [Teloschistes exilis]
DMLITLSGGRVARLVHSLRQEARYEGVSYANAGSEETVEDMAAHAPMVWLCSHGGYAGDPVIIPDNSRPVPTGITIPLVADAAGRTRMLTANFAALIRQYEQEYVDQLVDDLLRDSRQRLGLPDTEE